MSMASYTPTCSAVQSPDELGVQLGYIIGNKLQFAGEQSKIIYDLCLKQVSACQLSARCIRLFNTILNQTIGYQKREDHATTTRLQELTKIRHDHIGEAIRFLSHANVIQWRKGGKYNNYLSVNFHFSSWFQKDPAQRITTNDPTILLPEHYKKPIDEGFGADFLEDDSNDYPVSDTSLDKHQDTEIETKIIEPKLEDTNKTSDVNHSRMDKKAIVQIIEEVLEQYQHKQFNPVIEATSKLEEILEQATTKPCNTATVATIEAASKLEEILEQATTKPCNTATVATPEKTELINIETVTEISSPENIVSIEEYQQLKQQSEQLQQQVNDLVEIKNNQSNDLSQFKDNQEILEQQLLERWTYGQSQAETIEANAQTIETDAQTIEDLKQENQNLQNQGRNHLKNSIHQAVNTSASNQVLAQFANLKYPEQLSKEERVSVQKLVSKAGSREQDILDLLKIRMSNTVDPLNNRLSYFASLINRHRRGELDFSALESFQTPQAPETAEDIRTKRAIYTGLDALIDVYREHHYKRVYYRNQLEADYSENNQDYYTDHNNRAHAVYDEICAYVEKHQLNKNMIAGLKNW